MICLLVGLMIVTMEESNKSINLKKSNVFGTSIDYILHRGAGYRMCVCVRPVTIRPVSILWIVETYDTRIVPRASVSRYRDTHDLL